MRTDLAAEVERGSDVLGRVVEAVEAMGAQRERIERLAEQLAEIATFSGVIKEVADKTKLLALNATIEAARAGVHGAAFRVVADEIGKLAADSEAQTRRIASVVAATHSDLEPLREAIDAARTHGDGVADARDARETVRRIGELAEQLTEPAERVAAAAEEQLQALGEMSGHMQGSVLAVAEVDEHATQMSAQALGLSSSAEDVYDLLLPFWTDSFVDRAGEVGRRLAGEIGAVLEGVVDSGTGSLAQVLDPRYEEITGARIASLRRLFDVSRVPLSGFDPPKHATGYDHLVDEPLMDLYDRTLAQNPWLVLAAGSDLNVYAPVHARALCADWTGEPSRTSSATGSSASSPTTRPWSAPTASASGGASCPTGRCRGPRCARPAATWSRPPGGEQRRLVQTYARDTGAIFTVLSVPVYVHGERWGAAVIGWDPDKVAT